MISLEIQKIIEDIFSDVKNIYQSDQIQINCPKCQDEDGLQQPDGRYNLEINTSKKIFKCWRCDDPPFSGSLSKLIRKYGSNSDYILYKQYAGNELYRYDDVIDITDIDDDNLVELPKEFIPFSKMNINDKRHVEAYNYITNKRQLPIDLLRKFNVGFCVEGKYRNRIIVPSYNKNGDVNYFISRFWFDSKKIPKYDNPEANKSKIIFNESRIKWDSTVYLVEGVFDMLSIPINTIPLLGKTISDAILEKILKFKPNIVILLDPDAIKNAKDILIYLTSIYGNEYDKVKIVELPNNDDIDELRIKCG